MINQRLAGEQKHRPMAARVDAIMLSFTTHGLDGEAISHRILDDH